MNLQAVTEGTDNNPSGCYECVIPVPGGDDISLLSIFSERWNSL